YQEIVSLSGLQILHLNEASERRKKKDLLSEERNDELLCLFFRGSSVALRGKCEALPPQDEILPVARRPSRKNPIKIFGSVGNYFLK
ncbi:MAG: hypothetical protein U9R03_02425, partial [Candidatus Aerophobetes bacterium]|nr:hypothetical protein [Candidatus Aerophobetes bacterium]